MRNIGWRYFPNPWRKYCGRWWRHWFDFVALYRDIKDAVQRAFRGWGDGDIFDLVPYHAGVTLDLLKHFRNNHSGTDGSTPEEYNAKLDIAIDAWEAKVTLLSDEGLDGTQDYDEWAAPLKKRWEEGHPVFLEIYDSLWN